MARNVSTYDSANASIVSGLNKSVLNSHHPRSLAPCAATINERSYFDTPRSILTGAIMHATPPGNDCVAVLTEHSAEMVIATLAVLAAGKISLALHPQLPEAAQRSVVLDAAPVLLLATAGCAARARAIAETTCT